jgi:hypothetical protein
VWRLARDYLDLLAARVPGLLGYDRTRLEAALADRRPGLLARAATRSLARRLRTDELVPGLV